MDVPLAYEFILYKHGPFSFDLSDEITALRADCILKIEPRPYPYGPSLLPGEVSHSLKANYPTTLKRYKTKVKYVASKLGDKDVTELERIATALYLTKGKARDDLLSLARDIHKLKPHISIDEGISALKFVTDVKEEVRLEKI